MAKETDRTELEKGLGEVYVVYGDDANVDVVCDNPSTARAVSVVMDEDGGGGEPVRKPIFTSVALYRAWRAERALIAKGAKL